LNLYIDGQPAGTTATNLTPVENTEPVLIGAFFTTNFGITFFWQGLIDEVELFNRALSQSEIQLIVNAGSAGKCKQGTRPHPTPRPRPTPAPRLTS